MNKKRINSPGNVKIRTAISISYEVKGNDLVIFFGRYRAMHRDICEILQKDSEVWDLFSRKEEYTSSIHDKYGRFPYFASTNRNIFEPTVSKYLIEQGYHARYPEDRPFAVCLTHDIDLLYKTPGMKGLEALSKIPATGLSSGRDFLGQIQSKKVPWWNFSEIVALEDRYEAKSSFYFMVQDPGDPEYNYPPEDCASIMGEISDGEGKSDCMAGIPRTGTLVR